MDDIDYTLRTLKYQNQVLHLWKLYGHHQYKGNKINKYFIDVSIPVGNWWFYETIEGGQWINRNDKELCEKLNIYGKERSSCDSLGKKEMSLKAIKRRIKKHTKYVPYGTQLLVSNRFCGYDLVIVKSKKN